MKLLYLTEDKDPDDEQQHLCDPDLPLPLCINICSDASSAPPDLSDDEDAEGAHDDERRQLCHQEEDGAVGGAHGHRLGLSVVGLRRI